MKYSRSRINFYERPHSVLWLALPRSFCGWCVFVCCVLCIECVHVIGRQQREYVWFQRRIANATNIDNKQCCWGTCLCSMWWVIMGANGAYSGVSALTTDGLVSESVAGLGLFPRFRALCCLPTRLSLECRFATRWRDIAPPFCIVTNDCDMRYERPASDRTLAFEPKRFCGSRKVPVDADKLSSASERASARQNTV